MKKSDTVKCRYSHCLHESKEINRDQAVKKGNAYYHSDCLQTQTEIKEIIDLFTNKINKNPVYAQLNSVINNIVFTKGLGSNFLLFGLRYYIEHKIPLNYPQGLYYVIQNRSVIDAYHKEKAKTVKQAIEIAAESEDLTFTHNPTRAKGFADILR